MAALARAPDAAAAGVREPATEQAPASEPVPAREARRRAPVLDWVTEEVPGPEPERMRAAEMAASVSVRSAPEAT
jgi:hypothetical protein